MEVVAEAMDASLGAFELNSLRLNSLEQENVFRHLRFLCGVGWKRAGGLHIGRAREAGFIAPGRIPGSGSGQAHGKCGDFRLVERTGGFPGRSSIEAVASEEARPVPSGRHTAVSRRVVAMN